MILAMENWGVISDQVKMLVLSCPCIMLASFYRNYSAKPSLHDGKAVALATALQSRMT